MHDHSCWSAVQARLYFDAGSRARRRGTFLCSAKEKYPKEKRPEGLPANAGSLRFSQKPALTQLAISLRSITQTSVSFIRFFLRCSAAPMGGVIQNPTPPCV